MNDLKGKEKNITQTDTCSHTQIKRTRRGRDTDKIESLAAGGTQVEEDR